MQKQPRRCGKCPWPDSYIADTLHLHRTHPHCRLHTRMPVEWSVVICQFFYESGRQRSNSTSKQSAIILEDECPFQVCRILHRHHKVCSKSFKTESEEHRLLQHMGIHNDCTALKHISQPSDAQKYNAMRHFVISHTRPPVSFHDTKLQRIVAEA